VTDELLFTMKTKTLLLAFFLVAAPVACLLGAWVGHSLAEYQHKQSIASDFERCKPYKVGQQAYVGVDELGWRHCFVQPAHSMGSVKVMRSVIGEPHKVK